MSIRISILSAGVLLPVLMLFVPAARGANLPPSVSITSPLQGSQAQVPPGVTLTASADDLDGSVARVEFYVDYEKVGEATNSPFSILWATNVGGLHTVEAWAIDNLDATTISSSVDFFLTTTNGLLAVNVTNPPATVNLTAEGAADWVHWGLITENSFDRKLGVTPALSNYTLIGPGPVFSYNDNPAGFSWSDGTPTASVSNSTTGIYAVGINSGFQVEVPASTTARTLKLYVGAYGARGKLRAYLTDYSAPILIDTNTLDYVGNGPGAVYTFTYAAASPGQKLIVTLTVDSVYDFFGNVTLQAATLAGGNLPPTASISSPANNASFLTPASVVIQANASDPDGSVARVEYFQGAGKLGETTNSPHTFSWNNVPAGYYTLTVKATDNGGATFVSSPVDVFVGVGGGTVAGSRAAAPANINLTTEGASDWGHWGLLNASTFSHRSGGTQITTYTALGSPVQRLTDSPTAFTWNNGAAPNTSVTSTSTGAYIAGLANGFRLTVPADTTLRRLRVFAGLYGARGKFRATLSDFSAPPYVDTSLQNLFGTSLSVFTVRYAARSAGQTLTIEWTADALFDVDYGNVTLEAASLSQPVFGPFGVVWGTGTNRLSFPTDALSGYLVEFTDSFTPVNWQPLTNFTGTGSLTNVIDPGSPGLLKRFYRIRLD